MLIMLRCKSAPELRLGPNDEIRFHRGYVEIDPEEVPGWEAWIGRPGQPRVDVLGSDEAPDTDPNAQLCDICGKAFKSRLGLNSHLRAHARAVLKD